MTRISDALIPPGSFQKRLEYLRYSDQLFQGSLPAKITEREIRYNEYLAANPHPNLYQYYGVTEDLGYVMSLVFKKYSCDLQQFVDNCRKYVVEDVFAQLSGAVEHIHRLKLVHVDIKPENVFVDEESDPVKFVLGDFDSMHAEEEKRNRKWATKGWTDEEISSKGIAVKEMDWYGLNKIKDWLKEKKATQKGREERQKKIEAFKKKEARKDERGTRRKLDGG